MPTYTPAQLKTARRALGMTQAQLAAEMRVTASTVARWEQGWYPIPPWARRLVELLSERRACA